MGLLRGLSFSVSICFQIRPENRSPKTDLSISQYIGGMVSLTKLKMCEDKLATITRQLIRKYVNQKLMSQTVGFISIVVLKVCDVESPTLEELMVKGEKNFDPKNGQK